MSAVLAEHAAPRAQARHDIAVVLLGTGNVGGAFLHLLRTPAAQDLRLVGAANSRHQQVAPTALADRRLRERLNIAGDTRDDGALLRVLADSRAHDRVVIDATASSELATRHPEWLAAGCHVVTANKGLAGGELGGWRALQACAGGVSYGDSATVGAGLPALATLRRLHACGDTVTRIEGVFSGSLSYLFNHYDGRQPFSTLLREACALGYTEPDPRADLSGEDVARKLLILARAAGYPLRREDIDVENLVPDPLRALTPAAFLERLDDLDSAMAARHAAASGRERSLRYLARFDAEGRARVGLAEVAPGHPAAHLRGADNLFAFRTSRYRQRPLLIQGAGAGPEVTAQALLGDILALR